VAVDQRSAIEREIRVEARPETVFEFFTDPEKMTRWMGREAEIDPRPGGAYRIDIVGHVAVGEYVEIDPPQRVVFTWGWEGGGRLVGPGATIVEVTFEPDAGGTIVRFVHRDLPEDQVAPHAHGWDHYLPRLAVAAGGGDPGPDNGPGGS